MAVCTALALVGVKAMVYAWSGSVVLLASLTDSALDVLASGTNLLAIRWATSPPDAGHRYGHGKAEALSGLAQALVILGSAIFVAYEAVQRFIAPRHLQAGGAAISVLVGSAIVTAALVTYLGRVARETDSLAVRADRLHYQSDLALNLGAALAVAVAAFGGPLWVDGAGGLLLALHVGWAALEIAKGALHQLMDAELDAESRAEILRLASSSPDVVEAHSLRTRKAGPVLHVQISLVMPRQLPLHRAREAAALVEAEIEKHFPGADTTTVLLPNETIPEPPLDSA